MKMLELLANLYNDQGKFQPAILTFRKLIALNPKSKDLCSWQYNIVKATLALKDKREQVKEAQRLATVFQESKKDGGMKKTRSPSAAATRRACCASWPRRGTARRQQTQNMDTYALAQYLYKEYLENFPMEKDAYVMTYYYAELLYKLERWAEAAEIYTKVVKLSPRGSISRTRPTRR